MQGVYPISRIKKTGRLSTINDHLYVRHALQSFNPHLLYITL